MEYKTGKVAETMTDRNKALIEDYLARSTSGAYLYSSVDLITKYKISHGRLYQLLKKAGVKRI